MPNQTSFPFGYNVVKAVVGEYADYYAELDGMDAQKEDA